MLELENVRKVYRLGALGRRALCAVDGVSFSVGQGQIMSLIGESGSGKTTLGKLILRLIPLTSGRILFEGQDIAKLRGLAAKEYYRKVQGVFQDPFSSYNPIFKADRIFRIVQAEFFPRLGEREWAERVQRALTSVGLVPEEVLGKYPHQLSGGQLQRFLIARALLLDIRFLVADEIISMLDASTRVDVLNLLADLRAQRGLSILFITHDLSLAHYISDGAVILYRGRVMEYGRIDKVFDSPAHPYTRMLLASVPRLDQKWKDVEVRLKSQASPRSEGCAYFDRCPSEEKTEACGRVRPVLKLVDDDHFVACHCGEEKEVRYASTEARGSGPS